MKERKSNSQDALPERTQLVSDLAELEALLSDMQTNLPEGDKKTRMKASEKEALLLKTRRDLLKIENKRNVLIKSYNETLGLEFVDPEEADEIMEVVQVRKEATDDFYRAHCLQAAIGQITREFGPHLKPQLMSKITTLSDRAAECRKGLFQLYWALPDLGMTMDEWNSLTVVQRRSLRPTGRPALPLECQIADCQKQADALLAEINKLSKGKISTVEQALDGVVLSSRGRPEISDIGKMERSVGRMRRELERLDPKDFPTEAQYKENPRLGDTYETRSERLQAKIEELEDSIRAAEADLEGVAVYRRELEKQRARHRDLVVLESKTNGAEQASLLLEILRNELQQEETVSMIRDLDPQATETLTHRVNPKDTRERLHRLEMNGRLDKAEQLILQEVKESIMNKSGTRSR